MSTAARTPAVFDLVASDAPVSQVVTGFRFTEGPVWSHDSSELYFSDILSSRVHAWGESSGLRTVRDPSANANGRAIDASGRLVLCEHATFRVTRREPDGTTTTLASHYDGLELNSPNDVIVKSDGSVYFTDPATR